MGDEHGGATPAPQYDCEEPSAPAGSDFCGRPARADEGNADGSGASSLEDRSLAGSGGARDLDGLAVDEGVGGAVDDSGADLQAGRHFDFRAEVAAEGHGDEGG